MMQLSSRRIKRSLTRFAPVLAGLAFFVLALFAGLAMAETIKIPAGASVEIGFAPGGEPQKLILAAIAAEKTAIMVQAFGFRDPDVTQALIEAHKRGVAVCVVLDKRNNTGKNARFSGGPALEATGVKVLYDAKHPISHNKVLVFVGQQAVGLGSYNFTTSAKKNAENFGIYHWPALATRFVANFDAHKAHSTEP